MQRLIGVPLPSGLPKRAACRTGAAPFHASAGSMRTKRSLEAKPRQVVEKCSAPRLADQTLRQVGDLSVRPLAVELLFGNAPGRSSHYGASASIFGKR